MKNNKLKFLSILMLMLMLVIGGCGKAKDGTDEPVDSLPDETPTTSYIITVEVPELHVGDVVTFDTFATLDEMVAGTELGKYIMNEDGSVVESMELTESGLQTVVLAVQYMDGSSETASVDIEVLEGASLPDELQANIIADEWYTSDIQAYSYTEGHGAIGEFFNPIDISGATFINASFDTTYTNTSSMDELFMLNPYTVTISDSKNLWAYGVTDSESFDTLTTTHRNIGSIHPGCILMAISEDIMSQYSDITDEQRTTLDTVIGYVNQYFDSITTTSNNLTSYVIYDVNGNTYQVKETMITVDKSDIGGVTESKHGLYFVEIPNDDGTSSYTMYLNPLYDTNWREDLIFSPGEAPDTASLDVYTDDVIESYDSYIAWAKENDELERLLNASLGTTSVNYEAALAEFVNHFVLGDVSALKPPTNSVETGDNSEDDSELQDTVADVITTYASRFPQIYTWPESETKYSRWIHNIDNETQFNSEITFGDGTTLISGKNNGDEDWSMSTNGEDTQNPTSSGMSESTNTVMATVTSQYGEYDISPSGSPKLGDNSTGGRAEIVYNEGTYYIETARASTIQSYLRNSLYNANTFGDNGYQINEGDTIGGPIGKITPYTIYWDNGTKSAPYMAVYNINNDYLICYSNKLLSDSNAFVDMLKNAVTVK